MDIEALLEKWQARLGLSDWEITIKWSDKRDSGNHVGRTQFNPPLQTADVRLLKIEDRVESNKDHGNPETDLLHELLHIRFWSSEVDSDNDVVQDCREQAIEWTAKALYVSEYGEE